MRGKVSHFAEVFQQFKPDRSPFAWQRRLHGEFVAGNFPVNIDLPTGTGKTSVMLIWLLALLDRIDEGTVKDFPRRLVWVVDRRTVVDQASDEAEDIARKCSQEIHAKLRSITAAGNEAPLAVSTLRGEMQDNHAWSEDLTRPAIIVGTIDMIGSRLLFSGYGVGRKSRPIHAGILANDTLIVFDEAHLSRPFEELVRQVSDRNLGRLRFISMSATPATAAERFPASLDEDLEGSDEFACRFNATKSLEIEEVVKTDEAIEAAAKAAKGRTLVYVRNPKTARRIHNALGSDAAVLLSGQLRGLEKYAILQHPVSQRFASQRNDDGGDCWFISTSAGEVGIDICAETLITDLESATSLLQRFGRLNRFGKTPGAAKLFHTAKEIESNAIKRETLRYLQSLKGDISPRNLRENSPPAEAREAAAIAPPLHAWNLDIWSMTSLTAKDWPDRPPVAPWIRGTERDDDGSKIPETYIAWRAEVEDFAREGVDLSLVEEAFELFPILSHERLYQYSFDLVRELEKQPEAFLEQRALLISPDGKVESGPLSALRYRPIQYATLVLPLKAGRTVNGALDLGLFEEASKDQDVFVDKREDRKKRKADRSEPGLPGYQLVHSVPVYGNDESEPQFYWEYFRKSPVQQQAASLVSLSEHTGDVVAFAVRIAEKIDPRWAEILEWAARRHDRGKGRDIWQRYAGRLPGDEPLGKPRPGKRPNSNILAGFRHEIASLIDAANDVPAHWPQDDKDLALHLIAAHHGNARPHFTREQYDREKMRASERVALESANRFSRLQRKYGHWGLAYLEALFRTADQLASAGKEPQSPNA